MAGAVGDLACILGTVLGTAVGWAVGYRTARRTALEAIRELRSAQDAAESNGGTVTDLDQRRRRR